MYKRQGLGYAPDDWYALVNHLKSKGYTEQEMIEANVAVKGKKGNAFDRFRNRVMFPIIDLRGNVVAFGGRALDDKGAKYLNSSDTPVFKKSKNLFALNFAKTSKYPGPVSYTHLDVYKRQEIRLVSTPGIYRIIPLRLESD